MEHRLSFGGKCHQSYVTALHRLGHYLPKKTLRKDELRTDGTVVVQEGCGHAFILAAKFRILSNVLSEDDSLLLTKPLFAAACALFDVVMDSIGAFTPFKDDKHFRKREPTRWDGLVHIRHDFARDSNIEKVRMTLDTITQSSNQLSTLIKLCVDYENAWRIYPSTAERIELADANYDYLKTWHS